ncbi:NAD/ferredoxin-dependent reductase-like protein [Motilibacter rhizosphaerae]|uniref:NAD/ferredoxin-dependent reductase-like protein n=1 Tax=Motilibacter rhizosphaerae TaxID=598652 RepID=A0A4V2F4K7_9ACTN|nr:FAD-dependent oxidoreductase [Motilibacter rhizosphaerae]RZS89659.1 NAD/ferredoxin-dependent reductase-like protein [Motilibacter rhizosphaerae]
MRRAGVVVVGAGLAGVSVAEALRAGGYAEPVTLVGDEPGDPYDRPPLSKEVLADPSTENILRAKEFYTDNAIELVTGTAVREVGPESVLLAGGRVVPASAVVLATGGRARPLPVPGGQLCHVLRTRADAERIAVLLAPGVRLVVVGAGLVGAEVASSAKDLGCDVVLVDPLDLPLAGAVGTLVAEFLRERQRSAGVRLVTAGVAAVEEAADGLRVLLTDGSALSGDLVVAGVGITPELALARAAGVGVAQGILVHPDFRTEVPGILAVGDVAQIRGRERVEHWEFAQVSGRAAAAAILGQQVPDLPPPWWWTDRHGDHVEVTGRVPAAHTPVLDGSATDGRFTAYWLEEGRVVAAVAVNQGRHSRTVRRQVQERATLG